MNKLILLFALFLTVNLFTYSQEYAFGIKGGFNYYNIGDLISYGGSFQSGFPNEEFSPNKELGIQFGAFLDISFEKFYLRPELNFVSNKNYYDFPYKKSNWRASKTNFPILIGYKVYNPVAVYLGPSFNFFNKMTLDGANNQKEASPISYQKSTFSFMLGLQVEFKRLGFDIRYERGLKETSVERQNIHFSDYGANQIDLYSYKPSQISLSINVFLFRNDGNQIAGIFNGLKGDNCKCPAYSKN